MNLKVGGVPEHFNFPWIKLIESNAFSSIGVNLEWINFPGGTGAMSEALNKEEIHIAMMLTEGSVKQIADGMQFRILQKYIATPLNWGIYTHPDTEFSNMQDLKDTKAAISRYGSGSHLMTYLLAQTNNWNKDELSFLEVSDLDGGLKAIQNKEASYFLWEHFTTKPFVEAGKFKQLGTYPTPWPCFVIVVKNNIYNQYSEKINQVIEVVNNESATIKSTKNIEHQIAEMFNLKVEDVTKWLKLTEWSNESFSEVEHEFVYNSLKTSGILKK